MKASPQAWRRHGTRHEQGDTLMTHTHPPRHRNNGGYGLRCADWYEKEGNVSRHRPLGISNIWKKKINYYYVQILNLYPNVIWNTLFLLLSRSDILVKPKL